jgi:hypothetical protein
VSAAVSNKQAGWTPCGWLARLYIPVAFAHPVCAVSVTPRRRAQAGIFISEGKNEISKILILHIRRINSPIYSQKFDREPPGVAFSVFKGFAKRARSVTFSGENTTKNDPRRCSDLKSYLRDD